MADGMLAIEGMSHERLARRTIADYFAALRAMEVDAWVYTFSGDAVVCDPCLERPARGRREVAVLLAKLWEPFEDLSVGEDVVVLDSTGGAVKWTGRGIGTSGREASFEGIDVFELDAEGKIRRLRRLWDPSRVLGRLAE